MVVSFTNFDEKEGREKGEKERLSSVVTKLGGKVKKTAEFDHQVSHVVTPDLKPTMRTLAGVLTGKWVVCKEWIEESCKQNKFVSEEGFGVKYPPHPWSSFSFFLSPSFLSKESKKKVSNAKR